LIQGGELIKGDSAIAEEPVGKGHIVLFGFVRSTPISE